MQMFEKILTANDIPFNIAEKMQQYALLVKTQNETLNLTRIASEQQMAEEHFLEAVQPVCQGYITGGQKVLDFGTGGGFPGVPIAIYNEKIEMTLLDATQKKVAFIKNACEELSIPVKTIVGRGEELAHDDSLREQYDIVVVRAVAGLTMLLELCTPFIKKDGLLIAFKGAHAEEEISAAKTAANVMHMLFYSWEPSLIPERLGGYAVYKKLQKADAVYPRRYAKIKAEPL